MLRILLAFTLISATSLSAQDEGEELQDVETLRIAVLPFENISGFEEDDWLAKGFAEQLVTGLSQIRALTIIERSQIDKILTEQDFQISDLADETQTVELGKLLSVDNLLVGSYQVAGDEIIVNARIVNVTTGEVDKNHIISLKDQTDNIFELYENIIAEATQSFGVQISQEEQQSVDKVTRNTANMEAYKLYIQGLEAFRSGTKESHEKAKTLFEQALKKDKNYIDARRALARLFIKQGKTKNVRKQLESILKQDPRNAEAHYVMGLTFLAEKKRKKALESFDKSIEIDPYFIPPYAEIVRAALMSSEMPLAAKYLETGLTRSPGHPELLYYRACALSVQNKVYLAIQSLKKAVQRGFNDVRRMKSDPLLGNIRNHEAFKQILEHFDQ